MSKRVYDDEPAVPDPEWLLATDNVAIHIFTADGWSTCEMTAREVAQMSAEQMWQRIFHPAFIAAKAIKVGDK